MSPRRLIWFGIPAAASLGLYLLLAVRYPLEPSLKDPRASWASMVGATGSNAVSHLAIYLGLTLLYMAMLHALRSSQDARSTIPRLQIILILLTWSVCSGILMTVAPAGESHDIYDYIFRGRMMTEYRANPLVDVPAEFDGSTPYIRYLAWRKNVDTYGPLWEIASATVSGSARQLAGWLGWWSETYPVCPKSTESCRLLMVYITGYRLLAIVLTGLSGWLIFGMVRRVQASSGPLALAAWLLNPLTLVAAAVGAHNDAVMLVLVLLCWWLLQRRYLLLALIALILAAHVKLSALIWLPACILWIVWRHGWRRTLKISLLSAVSGLVLSWLLYMPFGGWQSLPRMLHERSAFLANSFWRILKYLLIYQWDWQTGSAHRLSVGLPSLLFAVGALLIPLWMFNFRPKRSPLTPIAPGEEDLKLWRVLTATSMLYLLVGSFWFQHWYVLWVLAPAALLPGSLFTRSILPWLTYGALASDTAMDFLINTASVKLPPNLSYSLAVLMIWGPVLLAAVGSALVRHIKRARSTTVPSPLKLIDHS